MHLKALILKTSVGNVNSALNINAVKSVLKLQLAMIAWQEKEKKKKKKRKANNSLCMLRKNIVLHVIANTMMKENNMQD